MRGLGFESYVCQLYVILTCAIILVIYLNVRCDNEILKYWGLSQNMNLVELVVQLPCD